MVSNIEHKYSSILSGLKEKIRAARQRAALAVNTVLLQVYWEIGRTILDQQEEEGWGTKIIDRLANDLKTEFPDMKGLSVRNLKYMRAFAEAYPQFMQVPLAQIEDIPSMVIVPQVAAQMQNTYIQGDIIVQAALAQLTWYHHITILDKIKDPDIRTFYIQKTIENGWSRDMMVHQIESGLHNRQGALSHNFKNTLPEYQSDLTQQLFKDPYYFDFLTLSENAKERDLENALISHVINVLKELGDGFAFIARQYNMQAGEKDYFIDLLFYHTKLHRHIAIELKIGDFEPEYVGKMNLYLGLLDDKLKTERDDPAIGLILCKTKDKIVAEYALRDTTKPIGIAEYKISQLLPEDIKGELPSIEDIEQKLDEEIKEHASPAEKKMDTLKQKLANLKNEEIQTPASHENILDLYINGLKPLYQELILKLEPLEKEFSFRKIQWLGLQGNTISDSYEELESQWFNQESPRPNYTIYFNYNLYGLKKSGTEAIGCGFQLLFVQDDFSYGFQLINYNQQPFFKKLYHQPLTIEDRDYIIDIVQTFLIEEVERRIENLEK